MLLGWAMAKAFILNVWVIKVDFCCKFTCVNKIEKMYRWLTSAKNIEPYVEPCVFEYKKFD